MTGAERVIVERAIAELEPGQLVNLGIGLPTLVPSMLPGDLELVFHSENGVVGMGDPIADGTPDHPVIDAGGQPFELARGAACFDSALSFALVRGGHLDVALLGAFEVSVEGDLANWTIPGKLSVGMGGAMELAQKARKVVVLSRHADRRGRCKLVERCALPLTARRCVDVMITERLVLRRRAPGGRLMVCSVHPDADPAETLKSLPASIEVADPLEPWAGADRRRQGGAR